MASRGDQYPNETQELEKRRSRVQSVTITSKIPRSCHAVTTDYCKQYIQALAHRVSAKQPFPCPSVGVSHFSHTFITSECSTLSTECCSLGSTTKLTVSFNFTTDLLHLCVELLHTVDKEGSWKLIWIILWSHQRMKSLYRWARNSDPRGTEKGGTKNIPIKKSPSLNMQAP